MVKTTRAATDYQALADFRFALRRFLKFSENAAAKAGLTAQQHQALLALKGAREVPTIGYLAGRLLIRHHSAVGLADRLVAAGLLRRRTDPADRRRVSLELTAAAEKLLARVSAANRRELKHVAPAIKEILRQL